MRRAVFLDRDGTVIVDRHYLSRPEGVELLPGAAQALRSLQSRGLLLVVISNQSGLARGRIRPEEHEAVHARFEEVLRRQGVRIDGAYYCPHGPDDACACRKPLPGMLERAARELGIELASSWMVGNRSSDIAAGRAAGCKTVLFGRDEVVAEAEGHAEDWPAVLGELERLSP